MVSTSRPEGGHTERQLAGPCLARDEGWQGRGRSQAKDFTEQHAAPPLSVEDDCRQLGDLRSLPCSKVAAHCVPHVRHLQQEPGPERLTDVTSQSYEELFARLGVRLDTHAQLALTHRSWAYEAGGLPTNERMEFLGDSVLGVAITDALYHRHPEAPEGQLAKMRSSIVNARALATVARSLGVGEYLLLGKGEEATGGRDKSSILADTVEALIGAVYLEHGIEVARDCVLRLFDTFLADSATLGAGLDWKTSLQELTAEVGLGVPAYVIAEDGPDHAKTFEAQVQLGDRLYGHGTGSNKKEAEQAAAASAYAELQAERQLAEQAETPGG